MAVMSVFFCQFRSKFRCVYYGRYLNKNVDDFEAVCKSLEIPERLCSVNCFLYHTNEHY